MSRSYEVVFAIDGSGAGVVREVVQATSDFSARRLIEAKYSPAKVRIYDSKVVSMG